MGRLLLFGLTKKKRLRGVVGRSCSKHTHTYSFVDQERLSEVCIVYLSTVYISIYIG